MQNCQLPPKISHLQYLYPINSKITDRYVPFLVIHTLSVLPYGQCKVRFLVNKLQKKNFL